MKKRKFAAGGTPALDALASGEMEGSFSNRNKDIYARARDVVASRLNEGEEQPAKASVKRATKTESKPSKEAKSESTPSKEAKAESKPSKSSDSYYKDTSSRFPSKYEAAPAQSADSSGMRLGPTVERAAKMARDKAAEDEMMRPGRDAIEGVYPEGLLLGGGLRGLMGRKGPAEAASTPGRSLATYETPMTFLGRSGAKNITPAERIAAQQSPRIEMGAAKIERGVDAARLAKAEAKPSAPRQITNKAEEKPAAKTRQMPKKEDFGAPKKPNRTRFNEDEADIEFGRGGKVKKYASGGMVGKASSRGDGIAQRGKTKGRVC